MKEKCETLSEKIERRPLPYSTLGAILLVILAIMEYLALFMTMRPVRLMIFNGVV